MDEKNKALRCQMNLDHKDGKWLIYDSSLGFLPSWTSLLFYTECLREL